MLTSNHNLGRLSDTVHHFLEDAVNNKHTSFCTNVWIDICDGDYILSSTFKEVKPIVGNRLCKNKKGQIFYLQIDSQGKLINKIRV